MSVSCRLLSIGVLSLSISAATNAQEMLTEKQFIVPAKDVEGDPSVPRAAVPASDTGFGISRGPEGRSRPPLHVKFGIERKMRIRPFVDRDLRVEKFENDKDDDPVAAHYPRGDGFNWGPAIRQSLLFLAVQHGYAMTQPKTRRSLRGPFLKEYFRSVRSLGGWDDGGKFFTNYVAHPMQGSFIGFIQVHNDPRGRVQTFGRSAAYWKSRMKALAWSAAWSTQFEIGPISQASIGNVGLNGKQTLVDLVMTPVAGTAMLVTEDILDKYVIRKVEKYSGNYFLKILLRTILNPTRSVANIIRLKTPWHRDLGLRP